LYHAHRVADVHAWCASRLHCMAHSSWCAPTDPTRHGIPHDPCRVSEIPCRVGYPCRRGPHTYDIPYPRRHSPPQTERYPSLAYRSDIAPATGAAYFRGVVTDAYAHYRLRSAIARNVRYVADQRCMRCIHACVSACTYARVSDVGDACGLGAGRGWHPM